MKLSTVVVFGFMVAHPVSRGQLPEATRLILAVEDTGNQNGLIEPGESARVSVTADLCDDGVSSIGTIAPWGPTKTGVVWAFAEARFDIRSVQGGGTGAWSDMALRPSLNTYAAPGGAQSDGSVLDIHPGQFCVGPFWGECDHRDPIPVWSGVWTPTSYERREIRFRTSNWPDWHHVVLVVIGPYGIAVPWGAIESEVSFVVAPSGGCYADCDWDGVLKVGDFGCFQAKFVAGDPYADCNADGVLTVSDFGCFQTKFVVGCP